MNVFRKNKIFRQLSLANVLSIAGDSLFYLALVTYASQLKQYSLIISIIALLETLPNLLESLSGYFSDQTKFCRYFVCQFMASMAYYLCDN